MPNAAPSRRALLGAALAVPPVAARGAQAAWPERPVRLIVPYSAGGVADTVARFLQPKIGEFLGQPLIVENRTGASGLIAATQVAQSPPDGHTLLQEGATFVTLPLTRRDMPLDYAAAFAPIAQATIVPYLLNVRADFPARTLEEFVAQAKAHPGAITYGTPGIAHIGHFMGELLQIMAGIRLEHVPYRGGADVARDLAGGRIDACIISLNSIRPVVQAGKARILACTTAERHPGAPEVPAIAETFPGYDLTSWIGMFAPAGTPRAAIERFGAALRFALEDPGTRQRLVANGEVPVRSSPEHFIAHLARFREVAARVVAASPALRPA
ncbi:Bug family tripartite tricarboxylate transporter substrate binding protein [Caldovatus aquaticus]|uniref:Tripartite tricarboxylate transporter substrate binding protein n=1 Tax=Caldovatus aquaticus TaxID=2865671 RepID=A0ABS7EZT5_9PROT|nr:tripartite tricarboxylate transporter substrate binding protein [Caldovatus aquaticus]MBW8268222.1 tripartite tricarboxylate transporter substrate binding protein [Caldovatus aquaticus]